ncbi:MAG TPA: hypothetical protein DIS65_02410, partial [Candidatus Marinimicrobia bacterium]|nr:hypothetical protein [Candidatus Neomarinimicrobiota bacterium]
TLTFTATDDNLVTITDEVVITVTPVNDAPQLTVSDPPPFETNENVDLDISLTVSDVEDNSVGITVVSGPFHGTFETTATDTVVYSPDPGFFGNDNMVVQAREDGGGLFSNQISIDVAVFSVNDAPVVYPISWSVMEDGSTEILLQGYDADGHELTFTIDNSVENGSLTLPVGNTVTFTPSENYSGSDSLSYYAYDGIANSSDTALVSLIIISVNDPPVVIDTTFEDVADLFSFSLDADDVDDVGLSIRFVPMDNGTFFGGSISDNEDGSFTYSMGTNTSNQDFILYKAIDEISESSLGLITFNIPGGIMFAGRGAPLAMSDSVEVTEDIAKTISFVGFDADNAFSEDASVTITQAPLIGSLDTNFVLIENGIDKLAQWTLIYTSGLDYSGTETIKFIVNNPDNSESESGEASISITVHAVNDMPTISALGDTTIVEDGSLVLNVEAIDADNSLTLSHASNNANFVTSWENDTLSVTPDPNYSGTATITVTATEDGGENAQISESFNVVVTSVNDSPQMTFIGDTLITLEDEIFSLILSADDVEGDDLRYSLTTSPSDSMEIDYVTGEITWTPENDDVGEYTVFARVFEPATSASDTVSFVLTVENVNDTPDIDVLSYPGIINEDTQRTFQFIPQDVDADDDFLNVIVTSLDLNLVPADSIIIDPAGPFAADETITVTLKPSLDQYGVTSIILEVIDDDSSKESRDLTFTVMNVNDAPVIADIGNQETWEDQALQITLNVTDVDHDYGAIVINANESENSDIVDINVDGNVLTLSPVSDSTGTAIISVTANDGVNGSDPMVFSLEILNINDLPTIDGIPGSGEISGTEDMPKVFSITPLDPDPQDFLTLSVSTDNPVLFPEGSIAIDPVTDVSGVVREIVFSPAANQSGSADVMILVTDGSETVSEQVLLTVDPANDAPIITPIPDHSTTIGEDYSYTVTAIDIEGSVLDYSFTPGYQPPDGMEIDNLNGEITWTSGNDDVGSTYIIQVRVSDDGEPISAHSEENYELTVEDANAVPELGDISDLSFNEDNSITFQITPQDDDDEDSLTVSFITNNVILFPVGSITADPETDLPDSSRTVTLNPAEDQYGEALVVVTVSDGESNVSREFTATVN